MLLTMQNEEFLAVVIPEVLLAIHVNKNQNIASKERVYIKCLWLSNVCLHTDTLHDIYIEES